MKILITGGNGQLGSEFKALQNSTLHQFIFTDSTSLDITDAGKVQDYFEHQDVDVILNCAAYTAVDQAEDEPEKAFAVNRNAVENLVKACEKHEIKLIHFSTDYVFDGKNHKPYKEEDTVNPVGIYGRSKLAGEQIILNSSISALIIRTSWLYSIYGHNFVKTMIRLGQEKDELNLIFDQIGTPTCATDLALASLECINKTEIWDNHREIYHFSNEGVASWYDFALAIFDFKNIDCQVKPVMSHEFKTKATRPHFSVLNKEKIKLDFGLGIKHWRRAFLDSGF